MLYLLDTDICSYIMKLYPESTFYRFQITHPEDIIISAVTYAELMFGAVRSGSTRINAEVIRDFMRHLTCHAWDVSAADHYSVLRTELERKGTPIGNMDMMIAAHALALNATVVTNNIRHYDRIEGLRVENWAD